MKQVSKRFTVSVLYCWSYGYCMVNTCGRVWINRVGLPVLLVAVNTPSPEGRAESLGDIL